MINLIYKAFVKIFMKNSLTTNNVLMRNKNILNISLKKKQIDNVNINFLIKKYHSPLIIVSKKSLLNKFKQLSDALEKHCKNYIIAYSFKTNFIPGICKIFKQEGAYAEIVSGFEYYLANKIGYKNNKIIFNGPYKKTEELARALKTKTLVNVDNLLELNKVIEISKKNNLISNIGIRLNSNYIQKSRFGFNIESGEAFSICNKIKNCPYINLESLHMHIGYNIENPMIYQKEVELITNFSLLIKEQLKQNIRYLDIGGGFPAGSQPYTSKKWSYPIIKEYIRIISNELINKFPDNNIKLIVEPGRYLVDEGIFLLASITSVKIVNNIQQITVDTSIDQIPLANYRKQEIVFFRLDTRIINHRKFKSILFGQSCRENDILIDNIILPLMNPEDIIVFLNIGAYNISWQNQFLFPRPPIIMINNKKLTLLRRRENYKDLMLLQNI